MYAGVDFFCLPVAFLRERMHVVLSSALSPQLSDCSGVQCICRVVKKSVFDKGGMDGWGAKWETKVAPANKIIVF